MLPQNCYWFLFSDWLIEKWTFSFRWPQSHFHTFILKSLVLLPELKHDLKPSFLFSFRWNPNIEVLFQERFASWCYMAQVSAACFQLPKDFSKTSVQILTRIKWSVLWNRRRPRMGSADKLIIYPLQNSIRPKMFQICIYRYYCRCTDLLSNSDRIIQFYVFDNGLYSMKRALKNCQFHTETFKMDLFFIWSEF